MLKKRTFIIALIAASLLVSLLPGCIKITGITGDEEGPEAIEEAWDIIFDNYVDKENLDAEALRQGAIDGMMEALGDPYSAYLDPDTYELSMSNLEGSFEGIGAAVTMAEGSLIIVSPFSGSPAEKAGIRENDEILEINGKSVSDMSLVEAVLLVRGPRGTAVNLTVLDEDDAEPVEIEVVRDEIQVSSVDYRMIGDIAYIRIIDFSSRTDDEILSALNSIAQENARGLIIDLRRNLGGMLNAVVDITSRFIDEGIVLKIVDGDGNSSTRKVVNQDVRTGLPIVVLVDEYSASGSEVLAGALQDYDRAVIAGSQTFGKGSVNTLRKLSDGSGIYITFARWYTPDGRLIEGQGITPDYELDLVGEEAIQWAIDYLHNEAG